MTDMTFETPRAMTASGGGWATRPMRGGHAARLAAQRREYAAYFVVVLVLALPLSLAAWALKALRGMTLPKQGPLAAAWDQAAIITAIILSA